MGNLSHRPQRLAVCRVGNADNRTSSFPSNKRRTQILQCGFIALFYFLRDQRSLVNQSDLRQSTSVGQSMMLVSPSTLSSPPLTQPAPNPPRCYSSPPSHPPSGTDFATYCPAAGSRIRDETRSARPPRRAPSRRPGRRSRPRSA